MMYYLDGISKCVILDEENMRNLYTKENELVLRFVYNTTNTINDTFENCLECIVEPLKEQLQNHHYIKNYTERLTDTDKLELLKETYRKTRSELNINWDTITYLFGMDEWEKIVKNYVYLNAYSLLEDNDAMLQEEMLHRFKLYEEERVNKVAKIIAIKRIRRNKLYFCGLAKKLSMRDCGIILEVA